MIYIREQLRLKVQIRRRLQLLLKHQLLHLIEKQDENLRWQIKDLKRILKEWKELKRNKKYQRKDFKEENDKNLKLLIF